MSYMVKHSFYLLKYWEKMSEGAYNACMCVTAGVCEGRSEDNVWLLNSDSC